MATHIVRNQPSAFVGANLFASDPVLTRAVELWGDPGDVAELTALGVHAGSAQAQAWGDQADRHIPVLRSHNAQGERIDEVEFHPAWHALMAAGVGAGLTAEPWTRPDGSGAHVRRAAGFVVWSQVEQGHLCPISMTYAAAPALRAAPGLASDWLPALASRRYDFGLRPLGDKAGAIVGMGMTEKQGGSDVRANTTMATPEPAGPLGADSHRLVGHKWFCSAPMSDAFLVLAQAPAGLSCFLVPRVLPDGSRNAFAIQRLKDKLGNRSNASSEIEFDGTWGVAVGESGRGVRTILDMVAATRLDCVLGSAATMRQALVRAVHWTGHREAFGARLTDQPLMRNVLADLALESEAATLLGLRLAHAVDTGDTDFSRLGVALGKFWVCKRTAPMVAEALECLGGAGYVEENGIARLYREAPLNSIWEGSGNVNALDVLRALTREPASVAALCKELDAAIDRVEELAVSAFAADAQVNARRVVEELALTLQSSLMARFAPEAIAEAFLESRLGGGHGTTFGTLTAGTVESAASELIARSTAT